MYFVIRRTKKKKENGVSIVNVCESQMQRGVGGRERETEGRMERERQFGFVHAEVWLLHAIISGCFDTV